MPERYLGQTLGKYRVDSLIGTGGFAWVFKGYDPELEIPVAIKVLKPQFAGDPTLMERFRREASTAAKLRHPNIVKIYAVGRDGDAVYFVMDYLPGGLADKLEATPCLPEEYVLRVGIDVACALGFAHREGVIHRDIKVDNILFDAHGNAVVADFGIARAVSGYTQQTGTNMVVGTPQYFAPEQARAKPLDGRADLYSLGVTLFRAATGRLPFEGDDWYEIARQHVEEPPPSPRSIVPALSEDFERVLLRCLAKSPDDRPATGDQLAEELRVVLARREDPTGARTISVPALPAVPPPAPSRAAVGGASTPRPKRRYLPSAVAMLVLSVAIAAALWPRISQRIGLGAPLDSLVAAETTAVPPDSMVAKGESTAVAHRPPPTRQASTTTKPSAPAPGQKHALTVSAPTGAIVYLNGIAVGSDSVTLDTLSVGDVTVAASVSAIEGCTWAYEQKTVTIRPGQAKSRVTLAPRACGTVRITVLRDAEAGGTFTLTDSKGVTIQRSLPFEQGLVVPQGTYAFQALRPRCAPYNESKVEVEADTETRISFSFYCQDTQDEPSPK